MSDRLRVVSQLFSRLSVVAPRRRGSYARIDVISGNIRVFCRVRHDSRVKCALSFPDADGMGDAMEIVCTDPRDEKIKRKFEFDHV